MKVYADFNEAGMAVGFYPEAVFPDILDETGAVTGRHESVPAAAVEITEEQWKVIAQRPGVWRLVEGEIVPFTPPTPVPGQVSRAQGKIQLRRAGLWPRSQPWSTPTPPARSRSGSTTRPTGLARARTSPRWPPP